MLWQQLKQNLRFPCQCHHSAERIDKTEPLIWKNVMGMTVQTEDMKQQVEFLQNENN